MTASQQILKLFCLRGGVFFVVGMMCLGPPGCASGTGTGEDDAICGNGILETGEQCDDINGTPVRQMRPFSEAGRCDPSVAPVAIAARAATVMA